MNDSACLSNARISFSLLLGVGLYLSFPSQAFAYVGPGAGFAFLGSAFVFVLTLLMALATIAFWPLQWLGRSFWRVISGKRRGNASRASRVIVLGLDGLEPSLTESYLKEGKLPNLKRLSETGSYQHLGTTLPPLSPVAWSTFQTGVNPGAHNIFDFLTRDKRFCLPQLASTKTEAPRRILSLGKYSIPLSKARVRLLRKSQPFWRVLGDYGVFSSIIRVPISYPPEKFFGNILSAMCTPDLKGTQGTFSVFTTDRELASSKALSGDYRLLVPEEGGLLKGEIEGPRHPYRKDGRALSIPFSLRVFTSSADDTPGVELILARERHLLRLKEMSPWIVLTFSFGIAQKVTGICRFSLRRLSPEVELYVSPININPERPALPISHPLFFSQFLAKKQGLYGTLGFMEDTWGRNEEALDDESFLAQTYLSHQEREEMFFQALRLTKEGVCACVFDASDRIQHMFWRYLEEDHPAAKEQVPGRENVIPEMYQKMDQLVGKVVSQLREDDVLFVMSDHGFTSFRRCVNINTWLYQQGYLVSKSGELPGKDYFQDIDWQKTRAFAVGLSGIYLNLQGRERQGRVAQSEVSELKKEIATKLRELKDPLSGRQAIRNIYESEKEYKGLYVGEAPDLLLGFERGYRTSWESVIGCATRDIFEDNLKAWSGDHDVDPELVPGVLFSNRFLAEPAHIRDLAPTILDLFAVPLPGYLEGKILV